MDGETANILDTLFEAFALYKARRAPLDRYWADNFHNVNHDGYSWAEFERGRRELEAALKTGNDPYAELCRYFERACAHYSRSNSTERAVIRSRIAERGELAEHFRGYADNLSSQINSSQDAPKMALALAAVLIENCRSDYRDTLTTLADLYVGAEDAGIDPRSQFATASDMATDSPTPGGCQSLAQMLREFESFAVVAERRKMGKPYRQWFQTE